MDVDRDGLSVHFIDKEEIGDSGGRNILEGDLYAYTSMIKMKSATVRNLKLQTNK